MTIRYFADTDTLHIEFTDAPVAGTRSLGGHTVLDVDAEGNACALTIEQASTNGGTPRFLYEQVAPGHVGLSAA